MTGSDSRGLKRLALAADAVLGDLTGGLWTGPIEIQGELMTPKAAGEPAHPETSPAFTNFAGRVAEWDGHPLVFTPGTVVVAGCAISGSFLRARKLSTSSSTRTSPS